MALQKIPNTGSANNFDMYPKAKLTLKVTFVLYETETGLIKHNKAFLMTRTECVYKAHIVCWGGEHPKGRLAKPQHPENKQTNKHGEKQSPLFSAVYQPRRCRGCSGIAYC